jgi:hypothetical protein
LSVQENDEPAQEVFPESERDFFSMAADDVWTFEGGRAVLHTGGKNFPMARVE